MKINHKLEISKDGTQRVICPANGLWQLQKAAKHELREAW